MKQYKSNITRDFCLQWTKSKAVQEYVSNMLDEGNYSFEFGEDSVTLTNHNVRVSHKALLLGLSDKTHNADKRGMFGCGVPQSMAALLAQDVYITILNAGVVWTPEFEYCNDWEEEILVINEEESNTAYTDYTVMLTNLTKEDVDEVKQRCLEFQDREVLYSTEIGDIISGGEGEIFSGEIYVGQNSDFKYSYNFKPNVVPLTQDRNFVDPWELKKLTAKLISMIDDEDFVKCAIESNSYDTSLVHDRYYTGVVTRNKIHAAVDLLAQEFVEENEGKLVTSDYSEHKTNLDNNVPSVYIDNSVKVKSIQESTIYKESVADIEEVVKLSPTETLEEMKENIMQILNNELRSESAAEVENLIDSVIEKSEEDNWY